MGGFLFGFRFRFRFRFAGEVLLLFYQDLRSFGLVLFFMYIEYDSGHRHRDRLYVLLPLLVQAQRAHHVQVKKEGEDDEGVEDHEQVTELFALKESQSQSALHFIRSSFTSA